MPYILKLLEEKLPEELEEYRNKLYVFKEDAIGDLNFLKTQNIDTVLEDYEQVLLSVTERKELSNFVDKATQRELIKNFKVLSNAQFLRCYLILKYHDTYELLTKKSFNAELGVFEESEELLKIRDRIMDNGINFCTVYKNGSFQITNYKPFP